MHKKHEVFLMLCAFSVVFCCSSVPFIIYTTSSDGAPNREIGIEIDIDDCPQKVNTCIIYPITVNSVAS